jgi:alkaline phosphatase D
MQSMGWFLSVCALGLLAACSGSQKSAANGASSTSSSSSQAPTPAFDPDAELRAGPMVGYSTMREVKLWVQTTAPAQVAFAYWPEGAPEQEKQCQAVATRPRSLHTAEVRLTHLQPGTVYRYRLYLNGESVSRPYRLAFETQPLWQHRTEPPAFRLALGSCTYINDSVYDRPGEPYGSGYQIFPSILEKQPNAMLWMGDNVYLREADWNSVFGIMDRYSDTRETPEMQALLGSVHHYAIWDDHDYGPNNSDRSFFQKETSLQAFRDFWANPQYGVDGTGGITGYFPWHDVDFFLLDNRYHRTPQERDVTERDRTILGFRQREWLIDALCASEAPFKLVAMGGQFLNPVSRYENYANFPEERQYLIDAIRQEGIEGVVFLSGDRHHSELSKLEKKGYPPIYDLTVSPLTSGPVPEKAVRKENNRLRVEGSIVGERNFGLLYFHGPQDQRVMDIRLYNTAGDSLWSYQIQASEFVR